MLKFLVKEELKGSWEHRVFKVQLVKGESKDMKELLVLWEHKGLKEHLVKEVSKDFLVHLVYKALTDSQVLMENLEHKVK